MEILQQLCALFGGVALLLFILYKLEVWTTRRLTNKLGWNAVMFTGIIGTPIHEIGHVIFCILFRYKIREIKLFSPDRKTGTLGYVSYSYNKKSLYQKIGTLFVGLAPFFIGITALLLFTYWMFPEFAVEWKLSSFSNIMQAEFAVFWDEFSHNFTIFINELFTEQNMKRWEFWLYLYVCLCIASHMAPSSSDLKGAWPGVFLLVIIIAITALISHYTNFLLSNEHMDNVRTWSRPVLSYMMFATILSIVNMILTYILTFFIRR
ncbi:metalloprotease family protein [Candidatus Uabimicrobium sp. HlEnr_7]|uniref:metalloprotease family protein n=1 Tax=Candidatus Uabimicrobium helgolandensis TaxID=3095367 RepID=UPI003557E236